MSTTAGAAILTAGVLGVTHAIEPDHVAGISSLTHDVGDTRLSALAGACFSVGHVVLVVAWLAVGSLALERTSFPPVLDTLGSISVVVLLGVLGAKLTISGLGHVIRTDEHDHGDVTHSHPRLTLPLSGRDGHSHGASTYLKTGIVGALFTLSPPVSMIVFSATLLPDYGISVVAPAVAAYGLTITVTMSLLGASAGRLFGLVRGRGVTARGTVESVAGLVVVVLAILLLVDTIPAPF